MEQAELSLRDILQLLWQGKFLIAALTGAAVIVTVIYGYFFMEPVYQSRARVDLLAYGIQVQEFAERPDLPGLLDDGLDDLVKNHGPLPKAVALAPAARGSYIDITVKHRSAEAAVMAARQSALLILDLAGRTRLEILRQDKDRLERLVQYWDDQISNYLSQSEIELQPVENLPAYAEVDPAYWRLVDEKGKFLVELNNTIFSLAELEQKLELDSVNFLQHRGPASPLPLNRRAFTALAGLFGLALSIFILLLRYYWRASPAGTGPGRQETRS